jgi:hypothetical protein
LLEPLVMQWPVWQSAPLVHAAPGPPSLAPKLGVHPSAQEIARQCPLGPKIPAVVPKTLVLVLGLFAAELQIACHELEPVQSLSCVQLLAVSTEAMVVVLYGAQTRGVDESAERPLQEALVVQERPKQTPGLTLPTTPRSPVLSGCNGSAAEVMQLVPVAQSPEAEGKQAPRQKPSVAVWPLAVMPSWIASSVLAVRQTPLSHEAPPEQAEPAFPEPETGAQTA